jgi:site-specific recombinase XerD
MVSLTRLYDFSQEGNLMFEEFENYLRIRKLSEITIYNYVLHLKTAKRFLGKLDMTTTKDDIQRYLTSISNLSANTILAKSLSLKLYFKWLYKMKKGYPDIVDFPLPRKPQNKLISSDLLTEEEVLKMINICDNTRDKALISVLFDSACRIGEIRDLNIEDIVIESDKTGYIVVDGKTGKRQVPLSFSIPALRNWLNSHPLKDDPKSPVFPALENHFGKRMTEDNMRLTLIKYSKRADIKKRVFCHLFRHSRLTQLDKKGLSHTAMKYFAGWSKNSNMPSVYSHFSAQDTKELVYEADGIAQPKIRKKTILEPVNCPKCETPNDKTNKYCYLCGMPLDENSRKEFEIEELVKLLIKTDPSISKTISEKIESLKKSPE